LPFFVQRRDDFISALERGGIDLILSDFAYPRLMDCPQPKRPYQMAEHTFNPRFRFTGRRTSHYFVQERRN
jgi:hypothetical protein